MFEDVYKEMPPPPARAAPAVGSLSHAAMTMVEAIRDAHRRRRWRAIDRVVVFGEDVGYFGGVFRCTEGLQQQIRQVALLRRADQRDAASSASRSAWAPTGCARSPRSSSPTTSIPAYDQIVSEAARLRYRSAGEFTAPIVIRMPLRRRHLRRADAQPEPGGAVHPCLRA